MCMDNDDFVFVLMLLFFVALVVAGIAVVTHEITMDNPNNIDIDDKLGPYLCETNGMILKGHTYERYENGDVAKFQIECYDKATLESSVVKLVQYD